MCGICGIIKFDNSPAEPEKIQKMMRAMKHRGPDDEGMFIEENIGLGFVRLSILDLSPLGHQPMFSNIQPLTTNTQQPNRYVIVHNGEVYNYIELREELKAKGYKFKSNTDTEVVLYSYIEWGEECLNRFNGMWAFAIYDRMKKILFCSRDRFGVKPFYYFRDHEQFIFASEITPILSILREKPEPDNHAIFDYLVFNRTDQTEQTFFEEIKKLQHGHLMRITNLSIPSQEVKITTRKWYNLMERVKNTEGFGSPEEYRVLFSSAVGLRLRSDVPVGVCLSGGLDSSSIVSVLLKDYKFDQLNTFSAVYGKGTTGDESDFIDEFNGIVKNMHFTFPTFKSLFNDLEKFISSHAEPIPTTYPYAQFKVMELAKNYVVVTLDGQGADEELAGYHYFFGFYFKELLKQFRLTKLSNEIAYYLLNHSSIYGLKTFFYFLLPQNSRTLIRFNEKRYLLPEFYHQHKHSIISEKLYGSKSLKDSLLNHFEYKLEHLLKWEDRNSMYFSLEARVPFLDYRMVEKTLATSSDKIISKGMTKYILREAMKGALPEKIRTRKDKIGFGTPQDEWFRANCFKELITEIINSKSFSNRKIINATKANELFKNHLNRKLDISKEIWKWINLELWFRKFID